MCPGVCVCVGGVFWGVGRCVCQGSVLWFLEPLGVCVCDRVCVCVCVCVSGECSVVP